MKNTLLSYIFLSVFILISGRNILFAQQSPYGVNLSGLEFGQGNYPGTLGSTYYVPTAAELNYYAGKGLKLIRLPFSWERVQPTLGGALDPTYLGLINSVVLAAATSNISIILDVHNYCRYPVNSSQGGPIINTSGGPTIAQFGNLWRQLAQYFANQTAVWGYDLMNEPHDLGTAIDGTTNHWFPIAQAAIDSIRKVDTKHVIIVEGEGWSSGLDWVTNNSITGNNLAALVDPNKKLVFEAHQYFDVNHSGTYGSCCGTSVQFSSFPNNVNAGVNYITPFVNWIKTNTLTGYVGEYGIPNSGFDSGTDLANWNTTLTNFLNYLQANCIIGTYWAGGPAWGNYVIGVEPNGSTDASQMAILKNYTSLPSTCTVVTSLGLTFLEFTSNKVSNGTQLNWQISETDNALDFEIEKSSDGLTFYSISNVKNPTKSSARSSYSFIDYSSNEPNGTAYYRLKYESLDGNIIFSKILEVGNERVSIRIYPNPFSESSNLLYLSNLQTPFSIQIKDLSGNTVESHAYSQSNGNPIQIGSGIPSGTYLIQITSREEVLTSKLVKY
jgi:endoglucanase